MPIPEGDHTLRVGFIDDPFVKTLAKEDIYKDTVNKWIGAVTVDRAVQVRGREAEPQAHPGLRPEDRSALRRSHPDHAGAPRLSPARSPARKSRR